MARRLFSISLFTLAVVVLIGAASLPRVDGAAPSDATPRFERPDPETVREQIKEVLSDPLFSEKPPSLWERFWNWLTRKLSFPALGSLDPTVLTIIVIWGVLSLLAVFGHWLYHALIVFRRPMRKTAGLDPDDFERLKDKPFGELRDIMRERAAAGRFREAIGVMMLALLRWLDERELLLFHQSKTNGDYVREYPLANAARDEFRHFAISFDVAVYGHTRCDHGTYEQMNTLFERILDHAGERP